MATIRKIDKTYYISYYVNGKRVRKSLKTSSKKIAEQIRSDIELKIARKDSGLFVDDVSLKRFFKEISDYYKTNVRLSTFTRYKTVLKNFQDFLKDNKIKAEQISHLSPNVFENYKTNRKQRVSARTINLELKFFKSCFKLAKKWNYSIDNPLDSVSLLKNWRKQILRFFSKEEVKKILKDLKDPYKDVFKVLLYSGMRRDELRFLEKSDIDFKRKRILIQTKKNFTPKASERAIPIHDEILPILKERCSETKSGLIFESSDGKEHNVNRWYKYLAKVVRRLKIPPANIHTFRHTYASWLVMSGVDLSTVQKLLGHSDIKTTMVYAHLAESHLDKAISKLNYGLNLGKKTKSKK